MRWPHMQADQVRGLRLSETGGGFARHHRSPSTRATCYTIAKPSTMVQKMENVKKTRGHHNAVYCAAAMLLAKASTIMLLVAAAAVLLVTAAVLLVAAAAFMLRATVVTDMLVATAAAAVLLPADANIYLLLL